MGTATVASAETRSPVLSQIVHERFRNRVGIAARCARQVALVKLGLFVVLLALATFNRLARIDRLAGPEPHGAIW